MNLQVIIIAWETYARSNNLDLIHTYTKQRKYMAANCMQIGD